MQRRRPRTRPYNNDTRYHHYATRTLEMVAYVRAQDLHVRRGSKVAVRADVRPEAIKEKRSFRINGSNEQCSVGPAGRRKERRKFVILPSIPPSVRPSVKG